jgi:hypothetical protein
MPVLALPLKIDLGIYILSGQALPSFRRRGPMRVIECERLRLQVAFHTPAAVQGARSQPRPLMPGTAAKAIVMLYAQVFLVKADPAMAFSHFTQTCQSIHPLFMDKSGLNRALMAPRTAHDIDA